MIKLISVWIKDMKFSVGDRVRRKMKPYVPEGTGTIVDIDLETIIRSDGTHKKDVYYKIGVDWGSYKSIFNVGRGEDVTLIQMSAPVMDDNPNYAFRKRDNDRENAAE